MQEDQNTSEPKCSHVWEAKGNWDGHADQVAGVGMNIGGPICICSKCGEKKRFTHKEWEACLATQVTQTLSNSI